MKGKLTEEEINDKGEKWKQETLKFTQFIKIHINVEKANERKLLIKDLLYGGSSYWLTGV